MDGDKDTVTGEGKTPTPTAPPSKAKTASHHLPRGEPMPSQSPINDHPGSQKTPPLPSSNPVLLLTTTPRGGDFGQSGSAVPAVSPPSLCTPPAYSRRCLA